MLLIIIFALIALAIFMSQSTRREVESIKRTRKTTIVVDRKTGEELNRRQVIDEFDDEEDEEEEQRQESVLSKIWDRIK